MSNDIEFVQGLNFKAPNENAPEYVKAKGWINNAELIAFLQARIDRGEEKTNFDVKVSKADKWYPSVDNWKPQGQDKPRAGNTSSGRAQRAPAAPADDFGDSDIPFITNRGTY